MRKHIELNCDCCGGAFQKYLGEFKRQRKNKPNCRFFCSKECISRGTFRHSKHKEIFVKCLICSKDFITSTKKRAAKTCSIACATKFGFSCLSEEKKKIKSDKIKQNWLSGIYKDLRKSKYNTIIEPIEDKKNKKCLYGVEAKCQICNKNFVCKVRNPLKVNKTCSKPCLTILNSDRAKANPNCGGQTNYKRYYYNGIIMDSSWEVELATWLDENKIAWIRSRKICLFWTDQSGCLRRYYPDFYLPKYNVYLDPKNKYLQEKDKYKLDNVRSQNVTLFSGYLEDVKKDVNEFIRINQPGAKT